MNATTMPQWKKQGVQNKLFLSASLLDVLLDIFYLKEPVWNTGYWIVV